MYISPFTTNSCVHEPLNYCSSLTTVFFHKWDPTQDMLVLIHATIMLTLAFSLSNHCDGMTERATPKAITGRNSDTMWTATVWKDDEIWKRKKKYTYSSYTVWACPAKTTDEWCGRIVDMWKNFFKLIWQICLSPCPAILVSHHRFTEAYSRHMNPLTFQTWHHYTKCTLQ